MATYTKNDYTIKDYVRALKTEYTLSHDQFVALRLAYGKHPSFVVETISDILAHRYTLDHAMQFINRLNKS